MQGALWRRRGRKTVLPQPSLSPAGWERMGASPRHSIPLAGGSALPCFPAYPHAHPAQPSPPSTGQTLLLGRWRETLLLGGRGRLSQLSQRSVTLTGKAPVDASSPCSSLAGSSVQLLPALRACPALPSGRAVATVAAALEAEVALPKIISQQHWLTKGTEGAVSLCRLRSATASREAAWWLSPPRRNS